MVHSLFISLAFFWEKHVLCVLLLANPYIKPKTFNYFLNITLSAGENEKIKNTAINKIISSFGWMIRVIHGYIITFIVLLSFTSRADRKQSLKSGMEKHFRMISTLIYVLVRYSRSFTYMDELCFFNFSD